MDVIQEVARAAHRARCQRVETAIEEALQGGVCGVLVDRNVWPWTVGVSLAVPYGQVHEIGPFGRTGD